MKVYNTLSNKKEEFKPIEDNKVKMYVCGPTVYDFIHIGNARPFVVFDTVRRYLLFKGYEVTFVQNFTDIDDKIIDKANKENVDSTVISERYIVEAMEDASKLNVKEADFHPKVTEEVPEIVEMIQKLIDGGFAYEVNGSVYFDTLKYKDYGKLSKKKIEDLLSGARVEVNQDKKNYTDFILWKPAKEGEPKWESPWSEGRPGWHIECSVMAKKYLGDSIDIHAGGADLIFPHHENEIAQSEAANGKQFAKYWMHNGFINIDNEKMSKSKGNFFTLRDIVEKYPYEVVRFFILSGHYRSPINFSADLLESAQTSLERIKTTGANLKFLLENAENNELTEDEKKLLEDAKGFVTAFEESMDDDFNTADAISDIFELVKFININADENSSVEFITNLYETLEMLLDILGLELSSDEEVENKAEIEALIEKRQTARKEKNWAVADQIRDELLSKGIILEDTPIGVKWHYKG